MKYLKKIILDMQSGLYAKAIRRILVQELDDFQVVISKQPDGTAEQCKILHPDALLMEVTPYTPWQLAQRLLIRDRLKKEEPDCKIILMVDDAAEPDLAEQVKTAKQDGLIDAFLFTSATESYLAAVVDSI